MKINKFLTIVSAIIIASGCTKLNEDFHDSINSPGSGGSTDINALLNNAYNDINTPFNNQDQMFALQECTTDEALVPTRVEKPASVYHFQLAPVPRLPPV